MMAAAVFAATPTFDRRVWSRAEGAPQAAYGVAQDSDGMLWFPTTTGLYSFDGVRFSQVSSVYGHALLSNNTISVMATRNVLAVSYQYGGVSVFTRDAVRHYRGSDGLPSGSVTLNADKSGTLYALTPMNGLAWLDSSTDQWKSIVDAAIPHSKLRWLDFDDAGTMWLATESGLYARQDAASSFSKVAAIPRDSYPSIIQGKLVALTGEGRLTQFSLKAPPVELRIAADAGLKDSPFEGPDGSWWAWLNGGTTYLRADNGVLQAAQVFDGTSKLGKMVMRFVVDRENNLWVTTPEGVERYRLHRLHALPLPSAALDLHIGRGLGDDMLVTSRVEAPLHRLANGQFHPMPGLKGVSVLYRQNAATVWLGGSSGLARLTPHGVQRWPFPDQVPAKTEMQSIVADRDGAVLVSIVQNGLYRFAGGSWTKLAIEGASANDTPICMFTGASGRTYLGLTGGRLAQLTSSGISLLSTSLAQSVGNILSMTELGGKLLVGGERGVVLLHQGAVRALQPQRMEAFLGVSGMVIANDGALWMHGTGGLFHVPARELANFLSGASTVAWEVFDFEDGLHGQVSQIRPLPSLSIGTDGKIYYATSSQTGWIDPARIRRNPRAPTVLIKAIRAGQQSIPAKSGIAVAAGTTSLEIEFAATALSIPERVRFRYRLDGVDRDWQQPGLEHAARYTNLGPGNYRFQVAAANEDGVWNDQGATLRFEIVPAFWQTLWFRLLAVVLLLAAVMLFYRWRIATAAARAAERITARLQERERIARNLHDNLLQGIHVILLRASVVLNRLPKGSQEERILEDVLDQAEKLVTDTRDEVMALRDKQSTEQIIADLRRELEAMAPVVKGRLTLDLSGDLGRLRPEVARELCQVLKEAVSNAARHSGATSIHASMAVSASGVAGAVMDNGIGIAADIAQNGASGHWGIVGMRERMSRIGGTLAITRHGDTGTAIRFTLDAGSSFS